MTAFPVCRSAARVAFVALVAILATGCPEHHHPPAVWGVASCRRSSPGDGRSP